MGTNVKLIAIVALLVFSSNAFSVDLIRQSNISESCTSKFGKYLTLGDIDGDGFDDLVSVSNTGAHIYYSNGTGNFGNDVRLLDSATFGVTTADVNNDGLQDVIVLTRDSIRAYYGSTTRWLPSSPPSPDWSYTSPDIQWDVYTRPSKLAVIDVNVDGIDDIIAGIPSTDRALVFYGSASGLPADLTPDYNIVGVDGSQGGINYRLTGEIGSAVASDGIVCAGTDCGTQFAIGIPLAEIDIDNDGNYYGEESMGAVRVGPRWQYLSGDNQRYTYFGHELGSLGDINGDGENDLIVSAKSRTGTVGVAAKTFVYLGKSTGFAKMNLNYAWAVEEESIVYNSSFGYAVGGAGDINNDGYADVFIGDHRYDVRGGRAQTEVGYWGRGMVWLGGPATIDNPSGLGLSPMPGTADFILKAGGTDANFGQSFAAGDINGDGFSDLVISSPRSLGLCGPDYVETGLVRVYLSSGPEADLWLNPITGTPDPAFVGNNLTYTIVVNNSGPNNAAATTLSNSIDSLINFVSANASQGSCAYTPSATGGRNSVACNLGELVNGGNATVTIVVQPTVPDADGDGYMPIAGVPIQGIVSSVSSDATDPNSTYNGRNAWTTIEDPAGDDCNDGNSAINPGVTEIVDNGIDDDCNPATPDSSLDIDDDGDGYTENQGDCDDTNPLIQVCNTPTSTDPVIFNDNTGDVSVTLPNVATPGDTTVTSGECTDPVTGITLAPTAPICVNVDTTAEFSGNAEVCITYDDTGLTAVQEENLSMVACDITVVNGVTVQACELLARSRSNDTVNNIVCASTTHFSLFAVGTPLDTDSDGSPDLLDNCPTVVNFFQKDTDVNTDGTPNPDGVGDACDNCTVVFNSDQRDTDSDGYGNMCDADLNNDGRTNTLDLKLYKLAHRTAIGGVNYNPDADFNGDNRINTLDLKIYKGLHRKLPGPSALVP